MYAPHTKWHTANGGTLARGSLLWVALMVMPFHDIYNAFMGVTQAELTIIPHLPCQTFKGPLVDR